MDHNSDDLLYGQIRDSFGKVVYTYTTHIEMVNSLLKSETWIKNIQIVLTAFSTLGFLGNIITDKTCLNWIASCTAFISLCINFYLRDKHFDGLILSHKKTINDLWDVREDYLSLLTDFCKLDDIEKRKRRDDLKARVRSIYGNAPETDSSAYKKARDDLKNKEYQFFTPEEIDQMLPEELRSKHFRK